MRERFLVANLGPLWCGFDVNLVSEVLPLTGVARVPWAPRWVVGVMNHQGRFLTLVNLAAFLGVDEGAPPQAAVLVDRPDLNLALCVAAVEIVEARDAVRISQVKQFLAQSSWITEALGTPGLEFQHLDLRRVLDGIEEAF